MYPFERIDEFHFDDFSLRQRPALSLVRQYGRNQRMTRKIRDIKYPQERKAQISNVSTVLLLFSRITTFDVDVTLCEWI